MLTPGPTLERFASVYGHTPYLSDTSSTSGGACSGLNPYAEPYHCTARFIQGILSGASILQPSAGASSYSSSAASLNQDSVDDYPEIGGNPCWNSTKESRLIIMVAPVETPSHNSSSRYPTIGRSEASDAWTPNDGMIKNLNLDFNVVWLQTIMESIQCMAPEDSPLVALAQ
jgi:hypothetical protein